jgi:hypothetical protein
MNNLEKAAREVVEYWKKDWQYYEYDQFCVRMKQLDAALEQAEPVQAESMVDDGPEYGIDENKRRVK